MDPEPDRGRRSEYKPPVPKVRDSALGCLLQAIGVAVAIVIGVITLGVFSGTRDSVCCSNLAWPVLIVGGGMSLGLLIAIGIWIRK